jgi:hypothetical protein
MELGSFNDPGMTGEKFQVSRTASASWTRGALLPCALSAAGFAVTVVALYPGYMTNDATFVHSYIADWHLGDWQSPLMTILWWLIDPIAPGPGSMFLLTAALYWLSFALIGTTVARRGSALAFIVPLFGLAPPGFFLLSMIWRDTLFAACWLLSAALVYAAAPRAGVLRVALCTLALILLGLGILLRPNAFVAAPLLLAYIAWPTRFEWKRAALLFVPALAAGYALIHLVYYDVLDVKRENPLHSLLVFDLGGITHFSGENQFPVTWSADETALLTTRCYNPMLWDSYWTLDPCRFVMARLERSDDVIFGTPRLVAAWFRAVAAHPLAYIEHRLTFMWTFLTGDKLVLELFHLDGSPVSHNRYFMALMPFYNAIKSTILFRVGSWLGIAIAVAGLAWRARTTPSGAFAVGTAGCAIVYVLSFAVLGVATDFRYAYWSVLACLGSLVPALVARREIRSIG